MHISLKLACGSILVGILVLGLKFIAYRITGSIALYSDAMESIINVATAFASLFAVHLSEKPADSNHPFGHHKVEYFSAVFVGTLIILAALAIFQEAYHHLGAPPTITAPANGLLVNASATLLNGAWCFVLIRHGRKLHSPALVADGKHLLTDVISSFGVLFGIILAITTGWHILDPILALLVACNILWSGWKLVYESIGGLMDHAATPEVIKEINTIIRHHGKGAIEAHDLRTRQAGKATFIEFHLVVPGTMTVTTSHEICDQIEHALKDAIYGAKIIIHVEPEYKAKSVGIILIAPN
jgi:cation diffusion facilitator family transporter